jgi:hypothetical protein
VAVVVVVLVVVVVSSSIRSSSSSVSSSSSCSTIGINGSRVVVVAALLRYSLQRVVVLPVPVGLSPHLSSRHSVATSVGCGSWPYSWQDP